MKGYCIRYDNREVSVKWDVDFKEDTNTYPEVTEQKYMKKKADKKKKRK